MARPSVPEGAARTPPAGNAPAAPSSNDEDTVSDRPPPDAGARRRTPGVGEPERASSTKRIQDRKRPGEPEGLPDSKRLPKRRARTLTEIVAANTNPLPPASVAEPAPFTPEDEAALRRAVATLERPSFVARLSSAAGAPLDFIGRNLPAPVMDGVGRAAEAAMRTSLRVALRTLPKEAEAKEAETKATAQDKAEVAEIDPYVAPAEEAPSPRGLAALPALLRQSAARWSGSGEFAHKAMVAASGALGGVLGLTTLAIELPVSTTIMLRAIAQIAREEGEDLADPEAALACVQVFALGGGRAPAANLAESGYFAVRGVMARTLSEAVRYAGQRGLAGESAPALVRYAAQVASRFGIVVSQKVAAQAVPVIGALGGAAVNTAFMDHFQAIARAHFTVRRLERAHGREAVHAAYERERATLATA